MDDKALMETFSKFKALVNKELTKMVEKGSLSAEELKNAKCAIETIEKIKHIERGEEPDEMYSQRGYYIKQWDGPEGQSWDNSYNSYENQNSYARGRNMRTGRYMSRDNGGGYSGDQDYTIHNLEMAMNTAGSEQERRMIGDLISKMKSR